MSISLLGSINVCKVNTGWADKIQSDRFENPNNMTCPLWNGQDSFGRFVHPDSFYTKNGGCNSADDRVAVENALRPQYIEYVALDAAGFRNISYAGQPNAYREANTPSGYEGYSDNRIPQGMMQEQHRAEALSTRQQNLNINMIVGSAGFDYGATNTPYDTGMAGVQGGYYSSGGMGLACGRRAPPAPYGANVMEGYEDNRSHHQGCVDTQSNYNHDSRVAQSAMHAYQSNMQKCGAGF
jgi:hypothetical protein